MTSACCWNFEVTWLVQPSVKLEALPRHGSMDGQAVCDKTQALLSFQSSANAMVIIWLISFGIRWRSTDISLITALCRTGGFEIATCLQYRSSNSLPGKRLIQ